nr:hypothetical protein [Rhizobium sp. PP-F2F-G48]
MLTGTGCSSLSRINTAGQTTGKAKAGIDIPDQPDDCRKLEPHAPVTVGVELRSVLRRERGALDRANARVGRCAADRDNLRALMGGQK